MAIKYLNPKSYGEVLQRLINGYKKVKGTNPQGLDLIKIKLEAMEQIRESKKIIKLPEEKITDYTKDRPTEGPKAEVEKFPKENVVREQSDLIEDRINKMESNNEKTKKSIFEISDELKELADETRNTSVGDFLKDYFNLSKKTKKFDPSTIKDYDKYMMRSMGLDPSDAKDYDRYIDKMSYPEVKSKGLDEEGLMKVAMDKGKKEKAEMRAMGLDPSDMKDYEKYMKIKAASKDKVTSAEDIIKDDDFDPSGMAGGGLAYLLGEEPVKMGKGGAAKKALEAALKKLGNKVTTADKIKRPESALRREMFDDFNKRNRKIDKSKQLPKKGKFMEDGETPDYDYYEALLNDSEDSRNFNVQGDETIEVLEDRLKQLKDEKAYKYEQYKMGKFDPEPGEINRSRLSFLRRRAEAAEMTRDFRLFGEDEFEELSSLEKRFEYLDLEDKAQNISRKMTDKETQRLKEINDSGYVDFQKEIDKINRNKKAYGGRIGYTNGGITKTKADYEKELEGLDFSLKKENNKILDILDLQAQGIMSGKQQIEGAPSGTTSDSQILDFIAKLDIPLNDKIDFYANYQRSKSRNRIEEADQEVYLDEGAYRNREFGFNYNKDGEGLSADATYNIDSEEPEFRVKYRKFFGGPTKKAKGGRIGFSAGGIDKARRGFLKLLGAGAGAAVTANTGLFGLMKGGKKTANVAKVATKVAGVAPNEPPSYLFDLVKVIRAKGKDITKSTQTIERETVKTYKGVELHENPDGFRIKAEGVSPHEGGKEIELMYSKTEEVKDLGLETQKSFDVTDYEEVTVRPDPDGKMKDVEFFVDEDDHNKLKKIVEDEKKFKTGGRVSLSTGGLAKLLGE